MFAPSVAQSVSLFILEIPAGAPTGLPTETQMYDYSGLLLFREEILILYFFD